MAGPLQGMKVIELSHIMSGPVCGMMLADMGADVIKVEKVPDGDDARRFAPLMAHGESASFMMLNRNKRGIALNLKTEGGRRVLRRMIAGADALTENYRLGTMEKLGFGYQTLKEDNPGLIYCSISGYGRTGPCADKGGFDLIAQGLAGLMSMTGDPGQAPIKAGSPIADINAGILAALGIVAAYSHRQRTGQGQVVDTSLLEAAFQQMYWAAANFFASGENPPKMGSANPTSTPYQAFRTKDGWINIGAANQANYERLLQVLDAPEIARDPRFQTNALRTANRVALVELLSAYLERDTTDAWVARLDAAGMPVGPVLPISEAVAHPQIAARGMVVQTEHPLAGPTRSIGLPIRFSATPAEVRGPAPLLGEHTLQVLAEYGFAEAEIAALRDEGAIVAR
ncbi:CoA-transferase [Pandoraea thiooxydans]|uniref:CoA-transferase n=1 Tax=Pandoraea thiooxydans TaxID=445709 RepID=A0A0G3EQV0_9BURK|nr:CaiB/BaiF CoA-transferase family protein [Pandoraea thiooxydans]AKJ69370.1 CoA-transferase [Pandoraea thiooxydans]